MISLDDAVQFLKNLKPAARRKAENARSVMQLQGYKDFKEFVHRETLTAEKPVIKTQDDVFAFAFQQAFNAGVTYASNYFVNVQGDYKAIKRDLQLKELELQQVEADLDDE